jgi:hypothetical protein
LQRARRLKVDVLNQEAKREKATSLPIEEGVAEGFVRKIRKLKASNRYEERALSKRHQALGKLSVREASGEARKGQGGPRSRASLPKASGLAPECWRQSGGGVDHLAWRPQM